jgi:hypothetical protein
MRWLTVKAMMLPILALACSKESGDTSVTTTGADVASAPVTLSGVLRDDLLTPVSGADVCVLGHEDPPCTVTDERGDFSLEAPNDGELALDISSPGMVRLVVPIASGEGDAFVYALLFQEAFLALVAEAVGVEPNPTNGALLVMRSTTGAAAELSSGQGPFYFDGPTPLPAATATQGQGTVLFLDVEPGTATFALTHPSQICDPPFWDTGAAEEQVPIVAGALTFVERVPCY